MSKKLNRRIAKHVTTNRGPNRAHRPGRRVPVNDGDMFCLIARRNQKREGWGFVSLGDYRITVHDHPTEIFSASNLQSVFDFWQRCVISCDVEVEGFDVRTLRLVKIETTVRDATSLLFRSKDEEEEYLKLAAVSKLTPDEARMLKLDDLKVLQRLKEISDGSMEFLDKVKQAKKSFSMAKLISEG